MVKSQENLEICGRIMGKKNPKLRVKTSRYFTKTCSNCQKEYPNWFTNCPHCGTAWDADSSPKSSISQQKAVIRKKTIKIVVKITEEDFDEGIVKVQLVFSADKGESWYRLDMDMKRDYYIAEIAEVPIGSVIVYYMEVFLENGDKIIENNEGQYYFYEVGGAIQKQAKQKSTSESGEIQKPDMDMQSKSPPGKEQQEEAHPPKQEYMEQETKMVSNPQTQDQSQTIFGTPQIKKDTDLKVCPYCNSKIKKMWSTCPICGNKLE